MTTTTETTRTAAEGGDRPVLINAASARSLVSLSDGLRRFVRADMANLETWWLQGNEVCFQVPLRYYAETCYTFQKHAIHKGEYQAKRVSDGGVATFKVVPGIKGAPEF